MCVLLHGSFTAAQDGLLLTADSMTVDAVILGTYVLAAGAVLVLTRGRLGARAPQAEAPPTSGPVTGTRTP